MYILTSCTAAATCPAALLVELPPIQADRMAVWRWGCLIFGPQHYVSSSSSSGSFSPSSPEGPSRRHARVCLRNDASSARLPSSLPLCLCRVRPILSLRPLINHLGDAVQTTLCLVRRASSAGHALAARAAAALLCLQVSPTHQPTHHPTRHTIQRAHMP